MTDKQEQPSFKKLNGAFLGTLYLRGIPDSVHREFKTVCAQQRTTMTRKLVMLMDRECKRHNTSLRRGKRNTPAQPAN